MNRRSYVRTAGGAIVGGIAGCFSKDSEPPKIDGIAVPGRIGSNGFMLPRNNEWEDSLIHGVNMGIAKPGHFPGETAITKSTYARWFEWISEMNANAIRVYTIHPPGFYEALAEFNNETDESLYLFHGNWLTVDTLTEVANAFDGEIIEMYDRSMRATIDVIHGNVTLPKRPGHAGGQYSTDVSAYVLGYIIGVEWPPEFVLGTNEASPERNSFDGTYVQVREGAPFESWLAARLNSTAAYEMDEYGWQRPLSFTNWVTTDHLTHPAEPNSAEDAVSVNPNIIRTTDSFKPGIFSSYHIYPYYPDFLNFERKYVEYTTKEGERSSYAGYLADLVAANEYPILVAEFGVPASRGKTHSQVYGMDQGHNTETQQGEYNGQLFEAIVDEGTAGGLVFSWQDEWFKRTWNTMDYSNPNRRPFWSDYQTCEQYFGLLSFDPGDEPTVSLSGKASEWNGATQLYSRARVPDQNQSGTPSELRPTPTGLNATSDERYLYIRIECEHLNSVVDLQETNILLLLDTTPSRGITSLTTEGGKNGTDERNAKTLQSERGIDFLVRIAGLSDSNILVNSHYDIFYYQYGENLRMIPMREYAANSDNGIFHPIRLALNQELQIPNQDRTIPFESYETGQLRYGIGDPENEQYDSLADFYVDTAHDSIELRLPWLLLNFRDPSQHEIIGDIWSEGLDASEYVDEIRLGAMAVKPSDSTLPAPDEVLHALPTLQDGVLPATAFDRYTWQAWQEPTYRERLKSSYFQLQSVFARY